MAPSLPVIWAPRVEIDWANTGDFDGPYDDVTIDTAADPGLVIDMGRDGGRSLNPPKVPALEFELHNYHRKYSHQSPTSPVYQLVTPGTPVRVTTTVGTTDAYRIDDRYRADDTYRGRSTYDVVSPRIDEITQTTGWGSQRVRVSALGASSTLIGRTITIPLQQDIRTDQAIAMVLDAAGWPTGRRALSFGDTTLLWWWVDERSAWDVLMELLASEGPGTLYEDANGYLHFEGRNYRAVTDRCREPQAIFYDTGAGQNDLYRRANPYRDADLYRGRASALYFQALDYSPGWRNLYAKASWSVNRRALGALGPVWSAGGDITLTAGQSITLFAKPTDPFQDATTPLLGTDYTVTSGSVTVALTYTSGFLAIIELTAGGSGALIQGPPASLSSGLQLRARPLAVASSVIAQSTIDPSTSETTYLGIQTLSIAGWPEVSFATAQAVCDAWVSRYNVQRPSVTLTVRAGDEAHMNQILARTVSDRIRITESNTGLEADVWIESRRLTIFGQGGRAVIATWQCEMCDALTGDLWGASASDPLGGIWDLAEWGR